MNWLLKHTGQWVNVLGGYSVILADCPWAYKNKGRGAATNHYSTMAIEDLCLLPVEQLAAPDSALFLWATWPTLPDALQVMGAWGFEFKTLAFNWVKTNKKVPTPFMGLGHWTRANSEPCLLGIRGSPKRLSAAVHQLVETCHHEDEVLVAPVGQHSAKPAEVKDRIIRLMGDVPAIELFARSNADPRYDYWGNEVESTVQLINESQEKIDENEDEGERCGSSHAHREEGSVGGGNEADHQLAGRASST